MKEHEANRDYWDKSRASITERGTEKSGIWRRCHLEPDQAFDCRVLDVIRELPTDIEGKDVCIIGSGKNLWIQSK